MKLIDPLEKSRIKTPVGLGIGVNISKSDWVLRFSALEHERKAMEQRATSDSSRLESFSIMNSLEVLMPRSVKRPMAAAYSKFQFFSHVLFATS